MKIIELQTFLVPYDFTEQTDASLQYALDITREEKGVILLAHFIESAEQLIPTYQKLNAKLNNLDPADAKRIQLKVEITQLSEGINILLEKYEVHGVILGKHENSIWENITGSKAMSLVETTESPFIIIQNKIVKTPINNILLTLNHERESLQATQMVASLAKLHDATVYIAPYKQSNEEIDNQTEVNQKIVVDFLNENDINFEIIKVPGGRLYKSELIIKAHEKNVDLIAASYIDFGPNSWFQSFIDDLLMYNPRIPIMTVNAPEVMNFSPKLDYVPA
jgi:hypothetical protein